MIQASLPPDEEERLAALHRYGILDTPPEAAFDDAVHLASQACGAPIALLSLVDADRQWFKAKVGVDVDELARDISFCGHAIQGEEVFEVPDALEDERFHDNPLVTGAPNIRFYAGAPLVTHDGYRLGTICVVDRVPRLLTAEQRAALAALSREVVTQLELRSTNRILRQRTELQEVAENKLRKLNAELEQRIAERTADVARSEARFRELFEEAAVGMAEIDCPSGRITRANRQYCEILGYAPEELIGMKCESLTHPDDRKARRDMVAALISGDIRKFSSEKRCIRKDGSIVWVEAAVSALWAPGEAATTRVAAIQDVTSRHQTEAALRLAYQAESAGSQFFSRVVEGLAGLFDADFAFIGILRDGRPDHVTTLAFFADGKIAENVEYDTAGTPCENVIGNKPCVVTDHVQELYPADDMLRDIDVRAYAAVPLFGGSGEALGHLGIMKRQPIMDVRTLLTVLEGLSILVAAEIERHASEGKFRNLFESAPDGVVLIDSRNQIQLANKVAEKIFGCAREELKGRPFNSILPELPLLCGAGPRGRLVDAVIDTGPREHLNVKGVRPNGGDVPLSVSLAPIENQYGKMVAVIARDMTEHLAMNAKLLRAQKMEAIGQLTGGIAHDFNNILSVIIGNLDMLSMSLSGEPDHLAFIERPLAAAQKGADLTQRLLLFARKQMLHPEITDVNALVTNMAAMLRRTLGEPIKVDLRLQEDVWMCRIDPAQLENAILNLAINARDAMPEGGCVTIETVNVTGRPGRKFDAPAGHVAIAVKDTGTGMSAEVAQRAFEPFYTTKEVGAGTGLGLSMVFGFAEQSGGFARIDSEIGRGATVTICIPRAQGAKKRAPARDREAVLRRGSGETILVVEDNADLREFSNSVLRSLGYEPTGVGDGPSALKELDGDKPFDLLLTDILLPAGMSGIDIAREASKRHRDLKILLMSGFADHTEIPEDLIERGITMLRKPFRAARLAEMVARALAGPRPAKKKGKTKKAGPAAPARNIGG